MANKRMFSKKIVLTDAFLDMPMSARCLYFTLSMVADDDGFVDTPKSVMRQCGASMDDMKILLAKSFVIEFETGIIVITHWRINNYLRSDRYTPTKHIGEYSMLNIEDNKPYTLKGSSNNYIDIDIERNGVPLGIPKVDQNENTPKKEPYSDSIKEILNYLNAKTGKNYKGKSKAHQSYIIARLREGFTVDDFKKVIDNQVIAWGNDDKMKQYIRPETLFCGKFETYLNNVEDEKQKRKREDAEINERQREAIRQSCEIGFY